MRGLTLPIMIGGKQLAERQPSGRARNRSRREISCSQDHASTHSGPGERRPLRQLGCSPTEDQQDHRHRQTSLQLVPASGRAGKRLIFRRDRNRVVQCVGNGPCPNVSRGRVILHGALGLLDEGHIAIHGQLPMEAILRPK